MVQGLFQHGAYKIYRRQVAAVSISPELRSDTVQPKPMSRNPVSLSARSSLTPLSKPPARPRNSSLVSAIPSMDTLMPMSGNCRAIAKTRSSYHPEVDMTMRPVWR